MNSLKIYQVDAFTEELFSGNPAAICILDKWLKSDLMQNIALENNLAETAFLVPNQSGYEIRWFTPAVEVDLCGHATLAAGFILFNLLDFKGSEINFYSPRSGDLKVIRDGKTLYLDFPTDVIKESDNYDQILKGIGIKPQEVYRGKTDYIAILPNESIVKNIYPDFSEIAKLNGRGLIVTSKGDEVDFVSRFFAPQSGIDEDPATGSAHTSLSPIWAKKLNKTKMKALQLSKRGGQFSCEFKGDRCLIGGKAKLYLTGDIFID